MCAQADWDDVYARGDARTVSWHEPLPAVSLSLIDGLGLQRDAAILDVGGGASGLAGALLRDGYTDITVSDISSRALEIAEAQLDADAQRVSWVTADIGRHDFGRRYALWHDRAVFHFMVDKDDRERYLAALRRSLEPEGHAIIATFGPEGPSSCSGLPVQRYDPDELALTLGSGFEVLSTRLHGHRTPAGAIQQFLYLLAHRTRS